MKFENSEMVPTAFCENMMYDRSVVEKCKGNQACIRKEITKCLKAERYYCEPGYDQGKSVNMFLEEKGIKVQSIIATQHYDPITMDTITKADYIRAESQKGYPFIIYLDARGYIETEGCITEMTCLQNKCLVSDSALQAAYKICIPAVRGVALFTNHGISVAMYNQKMQMITYHHTYMHGENDSEVIIDVAVPYPILPLSEIMCKPEIISERIRFVLEPLRKLFLERSMKKSKEFTKTIDCFPSLICNFNELFFEKINAVQCSIEKLREIYKENEKSRCPCISKCDDNCTKEAKIVCQCEKKQMMQITLYNIGLRERYLNEMIALYSSLTEQFSTIQLLHYNLNFATEILNDRYCDFENIKIDPSTEWAQQFEN